MLLYQLTQKKKKNYHNTNKNISRVRTKQRTSRVCVDIRALVWKGFPEIAIIQNKNWKVSYLFYKRQSKEKKKLTQ